MMPAFLRGRRGRIALWMTGVVAVLVHLPVLWTPFFLDDDSQLSMLRGTYPTGGAPRSPFDLYDFIDDANRAALVERGILPWWVHRGMVVHFLRPLSSGLVWFDSFVFGDSPALRHAHSLIWWGLAVFAVHVLFRRSFSKRVAWIATFAFALSPCHVVPLAWLANRSALVSVALGAGALAVYARWRESMRLRDGVTSAALFALALSAGEYAFCFGGYVLAIEIVRRRQLSRRALGLCAFLVPAVAYLAVHASGYGAHGTGFYRDPIHDFRDYLPIVPRGLAVLTSTAWLGIDGVAWALAPGWQIAGLALGTIALLGLPVARAIQGLEPAERARAAWLLLGSVLALGPVLAVELSARVLGPSMIGVSAIVALVVDRAWFGEDARPRSRGAELAGLVAVGLAFVHLFRAPLDTWVGLRGTSASFAAYNRRFDWVREHAGDKKTVVVLRDTLPESIFFAPVVLDGTSPGTFRTLSYASGRPLVLRTSERSLEMVAGEGPLFPIGPRDMFRNFDAPLRLGSQVGMENMRVTVLQLFDDGTPRRLRYDFDTNLDDPSFLWLVEGPTGFREQKPPAKGYGDVLKW